MVGHGPSPTDNIYPIHEERAAYAPGLKWVFALTLAATIVPAILLFSSEPVASWVLLGATVFDAVLLYAILPRRYQILADRVRIVLGAPFAITIGLATIRMVRVATVMESLIFWGIGFVTSPGSAVHISRHQGLDLMISPTNREAFVEQLNQALAASSRHE